MNKFDELYVLARRVCSTLSMRSGHTATRSRSSEPRPSYLRVGEADLAITPYTTDGDLVIDPAVLAEIPPLERALLDAGFYPKAKDSVGVWLHDACRAEVSQPCPNPIIARRWDDDLVAASAPGSQLVGVVARRKLRCSKASTRATTQRLDR